MWVPETVAGGINYHVNGPQVPSDRENLSGFADVSLHDPAASEDEPTQ